MKCKLLLGAYIDSINAQDINCYNIAKNIDKQKFDVHAFSHSGKTDCANVKCHKISNNRFLKNIEKLLKMVIVNADVYYLPRVEKVDILFARFSKKRIVSSVEIQTVYDSEPYYNFFNKYIDSYFCISNFLNDLNYKYWHKRVPVIYLGINTENPPSVHERLRKIIWIGSVVDRKRPEIFLEVAKAYPDLEFCMVGDGDKLPLIKETAKKMKINNIIFEGRISNEEVLKQIMVADLLCITSKEEGLPKVVLEAASKGVPSIYINELYSIDYVEDNKNGYGVKDVSEMIEKIKILTENDHIYRRLSSEVGKLTLKFLWKNLMPEYESFFDQRY